MNTIEKPTPRYLLRRYEILKNIKPGYNFLEIGAGRLLLSIELLKHFQSGLSLDFDPQLIPRAERLTPEIKQRLTVRNQDFLTLTGDNYYDSIVSCEVMEHIKDDNYFMEKIYHLLKPNGQVILSVPARMKFWSLHDDIAGHIRRYEKKELISLFQKNNFKDIKVISYGYPFINVLRWMRIILAKKDIKKTKHLSQIELTQLSNINNIPYLFRLITNKYLFLPLNIISSLFNNFDLSEGYIIVARKNQPINLEKRR